MNNQVPLSEQTNRASAQGYDEETASKSLLNLRENGKGKKVVRKLTTTKKKLKTPLTKSKSTSTVSTYKAYSPKFYTVIESQIYDTICN